jgi:hypothetical protein
MNEFELPKMLGGMDQRRHNSAQSVTVASHVKLPQFFIQIQAYTYILHSWKTRYCSSASIDKPCKSMTGKFYRMKWLSAAPSFQTFTRQF